MRLLGRTLVEPQVVAACRVEPLMSQKLLDVPDGSDFLALKVAWRVVYARVLELGGANTSASCFFTPVGYQWFL